MQKALQISPRSSAPDRWLVKDYVNYYHLGISLWTSQNKSVSTVSSPVIRIRGGTSSYRTVGAARPVPI
jgi:hypothetical protein